MTPLSRRYVDIDVIGHRKETRKVIQLFKDLGYKPRERFNAIHGSSDGRLIFNDMKNSRRVDVFLDVFQMCHKFDLKSRLDLEPKTIPISDLLSTKLQIVEINEKDIKDILAMLLDHDISTGESLDKINANHIARLCAEDWGVYKTFTINLGKIAESASRLGLGEEERKRSNERVEALRKVIEEEPKTMRWKMRAAIGENMRWYELPEADQEVVE